MENM
jgi:predicted phosphodiesterase